MASKRLEGRVAQGSILAAIASSAKGTLIATRARASRARAASRSTSRLMSPLLVMTTTGLWNSRQTSRQRRVSL